MSTIIACGCENYAHPDRMRCGATTAIGTPKPCSCDCHACTHVAVSLNRAEVEAAVAELLFRHPDGKRADFVRPWPESKGSAIGEQVVSWPEAAARLCQRWGIDR